MKLQERLRNNALKNGGGANWVLHQAAHEAADTIDALEARVKVLEDALREVANPSGAALVQIGQYLRPYEPISDENVCELLGDLREGVDYAFGERARAAEDALVLQAMGDGYSVDSVAIRAAIRAAVAHERERAARVCMDMQAGWASDDHIACAAAIRRGEDA